MARRLGAREPTVRLASTDITVDEMNMTVEEFFRHHLPAPPPAEVALEHDLRDIFAGPGEDRPSAAGFMRQHRADVTNKIEYWTGVPRSVVRALVERIVDTVTRLDLTVFPGLETAALVELTAYATTLAMNYLTHGRFIPRARRPREARPGARRPSHAHHRRPRR
jgi:hypothetical protein